jgi:hypothetical protein
VPLIIPNEDPGSGAPPLIRRNMVAFSDWTKPEWFTLNEFEWIATSINIDQARYTALKDKGQKVFIYIGPFCHTNPDGTPDRFWPMDSKLWDILLSHGDARIKNTLGVPIPLSEPGQYLDHYFAIDYAVPGVADAVATLNATVPCDGVIFDYGSAELSWMYPLRNLTPAYWLTYKAGYYRYRSLLKTIHHQWVLIASANSTQPENKLLLEGVGAFQNLTSYTKALQLMQEQPGIILCQTLDGKDLRIIETISMITNCLFNWRDFVGTGGRDKNLRPFGHFDVDLGLPMWAAVQAGTNVWTRTYTNGYVVLNLSSGYFGVGGGWYVPPNDGLIALTATKTNKHLPVANWVTNGGMTRF